MDHLQFTPGQFVSVVENRGGKEVTRAYSIASPRAGNRFALCLNRVPDGLISPWLFELKPGDEVEVREPLGYFTLRYREEFARLSEAYPSFRFLPTVTRPDAEWKDRTGRVQAHLDEALALHTPEEMVNVDIYICGLKEMVDDVRRELKARGFDRKQIIYEKYD
jgi:ferredoxin-NADP reductase